MTTTLFETQVAVMHFLMLIAFITVLAQCIKSGLIKHWALDALINFCLHFYCWSEKDRHMNISVSPKEKPLYWYLFWK